jgi:hypothetical protein
MESFYVHSTIYFERLIQKNTSTGIVYNENVFDGFFFKRAKYNWFYQILYLIEYLKSNPKKNITLITDSLTGGMVGGFDIEKHLLNLKDLDLDDPSPNTGDFGNLFPESWEELTELPEIYGDVSVMKEFVARHTVLDYMYDGKGSLWDAPWVKNRFCYVRNKRVGMSDELYGELDSHRGKVKERMDEWLGGLKKEVEGFES